MREWEREPFVNYLLEFMKRLLERPSTQMAHMQGTMRVQANSQRDVKSFGENKAIHPCMTGFICYYILNITFLVYMFFWQRWHAYLIKRRK